jgi:A/G-specific adenine glycosylase
MPWRRDTSPYSVVVSEIMLQQTQVSRVLEKYASWMRRFPTWQSLARASTKDVLREWSGLGYNRRGLYLKRIAETITENGKTSGTLPNTYEELRELPGLGPNTAGSIMAFAFNIPHPFIETNIRSVFIHHFFDDGGLTSEGQTSIHDHDIMPLIKESLERPSIKKNPREWYYALMDYGSYLKKQMPNPSRRSAHHFKQKRFEGSNRELRSKILQMIMKQSAKGETVAKRFQKKGWNAEQISKNLNDLEKEGFLVMSKETYSIK